METGEVIRRFLLSLLDAAEAAQDSYSGRLAELFNRLAGRFPLAEAGAIEALFPEKGAEVGSMLEMARFMSLEALTEETCVIPLLSLKYDFREAPVEFRIRVGLFHLDEDGVLKSVGYRFETPEGPGGVHGFYHAQPITHFRKDDPAALLPGAEWAPTSQPAIPIDATDPLTLLICVMTSLYGPAQVMQFLGAGLYKYVKASIDSMHSRDQLRL